ncbi:MAG TPA: D-alanyl-D-alanine carboxypeptidase family protein, partial [Candidatus Paceibacterota bacterium]|nr:D-alanyl-D-alanine carboxypeptidase family protein [Candidatus Paceibacterota bacterium]
LAKGVESLGQKSVELSDTLYAAEQEIEGTQQNVEAVQSRLGGFEQQVGQISGTVNTLEKLSKTDPELLQKYSKVYFLNEHYVPERLTQIPSNYLYSDNSPEHIHTVVWPYLKELLDAAQLANVPVYIRSAYRSFDEQSALKTQYTVLYGAGTANQFSADQGYSEHQLGTTVDFITTGLSGQLTGFENTQAYQWLLANAHKYGFTLSYPSGNPSYIFEPWHWRYVGISLAGYLHDQNKYFYDFEQREIDEYLVNLFD